MLTLEEAKAMITKESVEKLHDVVDIKPVVDFSKKVNNDILMSALCKAVDYGTIKLTTLNDRLVKLLNSETNTISQSKLQEVLEIIHIKQPKIYCYVWLDRYDSDTFERSFEWFFYKEPINFTQMFGDILEYYKITPSDIRRKMTETLKPTIVNNVSQLVSKFYKSSPEERSKMIISISTVQRLVNMSGGMLCAEFIDDDE
jgi:hypothetical protein